jgi:hypothetical protein
MLQTIKTFYIKKTLDTDEGRRQVLFGIKKGSIILSYLFFKEKEMIIIELRHHSDNFALKA